MTIKRNIKDDKIPLKASGPPKREPKLRAKHFSQVLSEYGDPSFERKSCIDGRKWDVYLDFYDNDGASKKKNIDSVTAENQTFLTEWGSVLICGKASYKSRRTLVAGQRYPCGLMILKAYAEHWGQNTVYCVGTYHREDRVVEDKYS